MASGEELTVVRDLAFKLYYRPGAGYAWTEMLTRLAGEKPGVFGQAWLYAGLIAAYGLLAPSLGWVLMNWPSAEAAPGAARPDEDAPPAHST